MPAMSEWAIALIAAGSAIGGSAVTGWYTRGAGIKQAEAARHAGDRQADALLDTVRMTLHEAAAVRVLDLRRQTYGRFLEAAEAAIVANRTGIGSGLGPASDAANLQHASVGVTLEGPAEVSHAARELLDRLRRHGPPDDLEHAKADFISAAQTALDPLAVPNRASEGGPRS
jgi:hypothetical protein